MKKIILIALLGAQAQLVYSPEAFEAHEDHVTDNNDFQPKPLSVRQRAALFDPKLNKPKQIDDDAEKKHNTEYSCRQRNFFRNN